MRFHYWETALTIGCVPGGEKAGSAKRSGEWKNLKAFVMMASDGVGIVLVDTPP